MFRWPESRCCCPPGRSYRAAARPWRVACRLNLSWWRFLLRWSLSTSGLGPPLAQLLPSMALRGFLAFKCFRWGIAYQHRGAGGTHTRRYSGMLAMYHRGLGEVAAIPATGTRTTTSVCAPACRDGRAIRGPLQPDTDRPIPTFQSGPNRELIFRGGLPPYACARVGPTNRSGANPYKRPYNGPYKGGLQAPIRTPVQDSI